MADQQMKKVRITLGVLTRVEYQVTQEVPADATDEEIRDLADEIYDNLDVIEFVDDPHYWERGETTWNWED